MDMPESVKKLYRELDEAIANGERLRAEEIREELAKKHG